MTDLHLDMGSHRGRPGACVMELKQSLCPCRKCSLERASGSKTSQPLCTNSVVVRAGQVVNDRLDDVERQTLLRLLEDIDRCRRTTSDRRINLRLVCWAARSTLDRVAPDRRDEARRFVDAAEEWLVGDARAIAVPVRDVDTIGAFGAAVDALAAAMADADDDAERAALDAVVASALSFDGHLATWYEHLLAQWEKAAADEGVLWEGGDEWAEEFCAFTDAVNHATDP